MVVFSWQKVVAKLKIRHVLQSKLMEERERERELSTFWRIWKCHRSIACTSSRLFWKRFARSRRGLSPIHTFWPNLIRRWVQSKFGDREDGVYDSNGKLNLEGLTRVSISSRRNGSFYFKQITLFLSKLFPGPHF